MKKCRSCGTSVHDWLRSGCCCDSPSFKAIHLPEFYRTLVPFGRRYICIRWQISETGRRLDIHECYRLGAWEYVTVECGICL